MKVATISTQRQITLPKVILEMLSLAPRDSVVLELKDDGVMVKPVPESVTRMIAGSVGHKISKEKKKIPIDDAIKMAKKTAARKIANE